MYDMKKTAFSLLTFCATMLMQAQIVGDEWYDGGIVYSATKSTGGKIQMYGMDEGEEHEFVLVPVAGKTETYRVSDGTNDYVNAYNGLTAKHIKKEGWDIIAYYNAKNELVDIMENSAKFAKHYEEITADRWLASLMGEYTCVEEGVKVKVEDRRIIVEGQTIPFSIVNFNGRAIGYITVEATDSPIDGTWEVVPTLEGLKVYPIQTGEFLSDWKRAGTGYTLKESNPNVGRFDYATQNFLTCGHFRRYKKSTLRIMRNAIMARNGYKFQSKDLQDYFGKEAWYKPAPSNDNIRLSFLEQINVELIKAEEAKPDSQRYVKEE